MNGIVYKLVMMLLKYLTNAEFLAFVERKVRKYLNMGESNPEAIKQAIKKDDGKEHGIDDMLFDAVVGLVTKNEMQKMKVEPSEQPTTEMGEEIIQEVKANI